jgi:N-acetylneuraminic acid mutarotase
MTSVARWRLPEPVGREVVVPAGPDSAVVAGGLVSGDAATSRAYELDLRTGARRPLPALPVPVHDAAGARLGGRVAVVGGGNTTEQAGVQRLSPSAVRWRMGAGLPQPRSDLVTAAVGGSVFVLGGYDGVGSPTDVLASSHGGPFQVAGHLPVAVRYPAVAVVRGAVWLFGGEQDGAMVGAVQRFDPRTGRARVVAELPRPTGHAAAVTTGRHVLLVGGRLGTDTVTSAMEEFDPSSGGFRRAGRLPYPLADAGVVQRGHVAYLLGGETPALTSRVVRVSGLTRPAYRSNCGLIHDAYCR